MKLSKCTTKFDFVCSPAGQGVIVESQAVIQKLDNPEDPAPALFLSIVTIMVGWTAWALLPTSILLIIIALLAVVILAIGTVKALLSLADGMQGIDYE